MTRATLLRVMSSEEMTMWEAFDEIDPISLHHRVDLAGGVISAVTVNKEIGDARKHAKPSDFMPVLSQQAKSAEPKKSSAPGELRGLFRSLIARQKKASGE